MEKARLCLGSSGARLPADTEALTPTPGTAIAPGNAVKGGGGARGVTVWAGEGAEKEGVREERARKMPGELAMAPGCGGAGGGKQSCFVTISNRPPQPWNI